MNLLTTRGYLMTVLSLPSAVREAVTARDWLRLDQSLAVEVRSGGVIHAELSRHGQFTEIEHIISIRSSNEEPDEDGIWHDDGSRLFAFSLSLTEHPEEVEGGRLEIRRRNDGAEPAVIPTPPFGTIIVFATGQSGFEHKINRVVRGERIIAAGWCT